MTDLFSYYKCTHTFEVGNAYSKNTINKFHLVLDT